ncbi:MAG: hypothetical protein M0T81_08115 [Thermoplasmatales archaeon]|nr:hypothetical protein [Thermoplasmatales archaeon]
MVFRSILIKDSDRRTDTAREEPEFFVDLNLGQIVDGISSLAKEYDVKPFFMNPLDSEDELIYRQEIFSDLENPRLFEHVKSFSMELKRVNNYLSGIDRMYEYQREGWFADAIEIYCNAVRNFAENLSDEPIHSLGMSELREYLDQYIKSENFSKLVSDLQRIRSELSEVRYVMTFGSDRISVQRREAGEDYSLEVKKVFRKFQEGEKQVSKIPLKEPLGMSHVEAAVLGLVAKLYPETFRNLTDFCSMHRDFFDASISRFHREVQFYVAYLEYIAPIKSRGLSFCIPKVSADKNISGKNIFDIALAAKLAKKSVNVVPNDFYLLNGERIIVVTGPNNGGKTTFARAFGQSHYLASLGLPVSGTEAHLFLFDRIFTHFEKSEDLENLRGKLEDDLVRIRRIFDDSTSRSIIIINEMLSSTTISDAVFIGRKIIDIIRGLDCLCIFVTFLDEITELDGTVSMVSEVDTMNPEIRTYRILRRPSDGLAYAMALSRKYGVTYDSIMERIKE